MRVHERLRRPAVALLFAAAAVAAVGNELGELRSSFLSTGLPGYGEAAIGDHNQTGYWFWLVGHQLGDGAAPWIDPYSFQPLVEPRVVFGGLPFGLAYWPLEAAFGPVVAWNVLLLLVVALAGLATYAWLRALDLPVAAALVGGLAFQLAPYRLAQSGGHLLGWVAVFLPLALLAIERSRVATSRRARHAWGALAALALVAIPLTGQVHLALGAIPFVLAYAAVRYRRVPFAWTAAGAILAVGGGLLVNALVISDSTESGGRPLSEVETFQASWIDFLDRTRERASRTSSTSAGCSRSSVSPGSSCWPGDSRGSRRSSAWRSSSLPCSPSGRTRPSTKRRDLFPPLRYPRAPGRLLPIAALALAGLAAFAVAELLRRLARRAGIVLAAAFVVLVAADLTVWPLRATAADPDNAAYAALGPGRTLELPIVESAFGSSYLYYVTQAPRSGRAATRLRAPRSRRLSTRPGLTSTAVPGGHGDTEGLRRLGIRSILLHRGLYDFLGSRGDTAIRAERAWSSTAGDPSRQAAGHALRHRPRFLSRRHRGSGRANASPRPLRQRRWRSPRRNSSRTGSEASGCRRQRTRSRTCSTPRPARGSGPGPALGRGRRRSRRARRATRPGATWSDTRRSWSGARVMFRLQHLYEQHLDELGELVVRENGKSIQEGRGEVRRGIDVVEFAAGMPTLMQGGTLEQVTRGVDTELFRHPLGVVAAITPFNFPAMVPLWTAPIAIAAGNTYILKPSERTPLSAIRLAELFEEAGCPPGVFNVVHGAVDAVNAICDHPLIRAVSFVGSAPVAKHVYARSARPASASRRWPGAKNHIVVMPDADLDLAVPGLFSSAFANAGSAASRGGRRRGRRVGDELVDAAGGAWPSRRRSARARPREHDHAGDHRRARERIADYIELGEREGARLLVDGRFESDERWLLPRADDPRRRPAGDDGGAQEEIFGPVLSLERLDSLDEALEVIAGTSSGTRPAIFTRDGGVAREFRRRRSPPGWSGSTSPVPAAMAFFPFAGWKGSFYGDLHATGMDGVYFFTESKVVTTRWPKPAKG